MNVFGLWTPSDNKFVTELETQKSALQTAISSAQIRLGILKDRLNSTEQKLFVFNQNIDFLRSKSAKTVSMDEFRAVQKAISFTLVEHKEVSNSVVATELFLRTERRRLEEVDAKIESVRFRLLEFPRREKR